MIRSITITNYLGERIKLELTKPENSGFIIKSIDGLGPAKANINTTKVATADGTTYNSALLNQRDIVMNLEFYQTRTETIEDIRQKSYKYFPIKKKLKMLIKTDNRELETEGYVETNEPNIFSENEGCSITILCPNPFFHSRNVSETAFSGVEPLFQFPFMNESAEPVLELGKIKVKQEEVVYYEGDYEVGVIITIHAIGDASNVVIHNVRTREQMHLDTLKLKAKTGYEIIAGDIITIDTRVGNKGITLLRDGDKFNILNCLDKGSDWFTLSKGDNIFAYTADIGGSNLQFVISSENLYEGV